MADRDRDRDRDGNTGAGSGGGGAPAPAAKLYRRSTNFTNATTTFATVFTFEAAPNSVYLVKLKCVSLSSSGGAGLRYRVAGMSGIGASGYFYYARRRSDAAMTINEAFFVGDHDWDPNGSVQGANHPVNGHFLIVTGETGGPIVVQARMGGAGTGTIFAGSTLEVRDETGTGNVDLQLSKSNANSASPTDVHSIALPADSYTIVECAWNCPSDVGTLAVFNVLADLPAGATVERAYRSSTRGQVFGNSNAQNMHASTDAAAAAFLTLVIKTVGTAGTAKIQLRRDTGSGSAVNLTAGFAFKRTLTPTSVKASAQVLADSTLADVFSIPVAANKGYSLLGLSRVTVLASGTLGVNFAWKDVPASADLVSVVCVNNAFAAPQSFDRQLRQDDTVLVNTSGATDQNVMMLVEGSLCTAGAGGTLVQQMASETTDDATVVASSFLHADEMELVDAG